MENSGKSTFSLTVEKILSPGLKALWESFNQGIMIIDKNNICLYINALQKKYDKVKSSEIVGKDYTRFYHSTPTESLTRLCITTREPVLNRLRVYKTVDGTVHQAITNVFPLISAATGEVVAAANFAIEMDIGRELFTLFSDTGKKKKTASYSAQELKQFKDIIGHEALFCETVRYAAKVAKTNSSVMITGETGTGKEIFAQSIHAGSSRAKQAFIPINCAAIPDHLLEGILFGTTKGSYTNAIDKAGLFELADGGSIFLDEINSMALELQAKILRVIQEKKVRRIGASAETKVDVRIISSMNIDPEEAVRNNILREDLFYRLAVIVIAIPPLRKRKLDIPFLARHFLTGMAGDHREKSVIVADDVYTLFFNYDWPGNIRELAHTIEAAASMLKPGETVITKSRLSDYFMNKYKRARFADPAPEAKSPPEDLAGLLQQILIREKERQENPLPLTGKQQILNYIVSREEAARHPIALPDLVKEFEGTYISHVLELAGGNVTQAARRLGISGQSLHYKLKKLGVNRPGPGDSPLMDLLAR